MLKLVRPDMETKVEIKFLSNIKRSMDELVNQLDETLENADEGLAGDDEFGPGAIGDDITTNEDDEDDGEDEGVDE